MLEPTLLATIITSFIQTASQAIAASTPQLISQYLQGKDNERSRQAEAVYMQRQAEAAYMQRQAERESEITEIQNKLALQEIEIANNFHIAKAEAERGERALEITEKSLELKKEELNLTKERLQQDKQISQEQRRQVERALVLREKELQLMREEITEKQNLGYLYLGIMREKTAKEIELKLTEIQANWDKENWSGILSREEMQQILVKEQKKHRLLMIVSPPDIDDCSDFNRLLYKEVRSELKEFLEKHYPLNSDFCPVEYYSEFFKSSVFNTEVKQLEEHLAPVPTGVIYSDITDQNVYFHISFWGFQEPLNLTLPWNWQEEKQKLILEGLSENESIKMIRRAIVKIHQFIAAFLADLYYLNINPLHEPRLFEMESELPADWVQVNFKFLRDIQRNKLAEHQQELKKPKFEPIKRFTY